MGVSTKKRVLTYLLCVNIFFAFALLICSFVLASFANTGFSFVLFGLAACTWCAAAFRVVQRVASALNLGAVVGSGVVVSAISLQWAVYWGQLHGCDSKYDDFVDQYSCRDKTSMGAAAVFSCFLFLGVGAYVALLVHARDAIINDGGAVPYADVGDPQRGEHGSYDTPYTAAADPGSYDPVGGSGEEGTPMDKSGISSGSSYNNNQSADL